VFLNTFTKVGKLGHEAKQCLQQELGKWPMCCKRVLMFTCCMAGD